MIYKSIFTAYFLYTLVYTLSFAVYEFKRKKYLSFTGVLILVALTLPMIGIIILKNF